jgi:hypothetical protein
MAMLQLLGVFSPRTFLTSQRKLEIFISGRLRVLKLYLDSTLLRQLKADPTCSRKAIKSGSTLGRATFTGLTAPD